MPSQPVATQEAPSAWTPRELAAKLFGRLRDRGLILEIRHDAELGEVIRPRRLAEHVEPIRDDEAAELRKLRPHVLAFLKGEPDPSSRQYADVAKRAAAVPEDVQADVRTKVDRLRIEGATNRDVLDASTALVEALGPHKDHGATVANFQKICGQVRGGSMAKSAILTAFEDACGPDVESRGAMFVSRVNEHVAKKKGRGRYPASDR